MSFEEAWQEFFDWYCRHGYYRGHECPDCDTSIPVSGFLSNCDPGDESDYQEG